MKKTGRTLSTVLVFLCLSLLIGCNSNDEITLSGIVESEGYMIRSEVSGMIIEALKNEGDLVKKGEPVLVIDSAFQHLVVKQQEAIVRGKSEKLKEARNDENSSDSILAQLSADLDAAKAQSEQAQLLLEKHTILAPSNGIYTNQLVKVGDLVNSGTAIASLIDDKDKKVSFYISQQYLNRIQLKDSLNLYALGITEGKLSGTVNFISTQADFASENSDENNSSFRFTVQVEEGEGDLKPGMFVDTVISLK